MRNNAIWKSYNRAVTISGTNQLDVFNNVIYQVKGHAIYLKYGNEIKNCICENVLIDTRQSFSLLNTDQTPASMWITNPDNFVRDNHVAGSDYYGYWYDHPANPIGSAYDPNICPENTPLTEFARNTAHSVGRYGLRIHNKHVPRTFPCEPFEFSGDFSDPYPDNPPITAEYVGFNGWKNGRNGAIAGAVGAVHFVDFKTADNILAGMEIETAWDVIDGYAKVINALTVGRTSPGNAALDAASPHGIIAPRSERFTIEGARFFRYDWDNGHEHAAPLGTASHASNTDSDDTGARHITVSGLQFTDVPVRIRYQTPFRAIFHDLDGSLTDLGANTWAVAYWLHLEQPECFYDSATLFTYGGILCDSSVEVRRLAFWGAQRNADFRNQEMKILKFDNSEVNTWKQSGIYQDTVDDELNYSVVKRIHADRPKSAWAIPFVTNHKYRIHWAEGLDFTQMKLELSERWEPTD